MIPDDDRGFRLGDGLFETILAVEGELKLWDAHVARLIRGCAALGLPPPDPVVLRDAAETALGELPPQRATVRLSWSAGSGGRALDRPDVLAPRLVATASPALDSGRTLTLATASVRRNEGSPASRLKTLAYLDNVLARRQARSAGADEALMLNNRGDLACAAAANLFWLHGMKLVTPALDCGVLDGTVRAALIQRASDAGWAIDEVRSGREALDDADAIFVTSSGVGLAEVSMLDGRARTPSSAVAALRSLLADLS